MPAFIFAFLVAVTLQDSETISAVEFERVTRSLHGNLDDISFIFEGDQEYLGAADLPQAKLISDGIKFQGILAYRSEGSRYLSTFLTNKRTGTAHNRIAAMLNWNLEEVSRVPDRKELPGAVQRSHAGFDAMSGDFYSPFAMYYPWYFIFTKDYAKYHYRQKGWEEVGGRNCLVVEINTAETSPPNVYLWDRFWIDLGRGGHLVRIEKYINKNLITRVHSIRLEEFPSKVHGNVWLPTHCTIDRFEWQGVYHDAPVQRSMIAMVEGSALLDQHLPDKQFTLKASYESPKYKPLARARRDFEQSRKAPALRVDPVGVRERLDNALEEAEAQSKMVEASSAARDTSWGLFPILQYSSMAGGVLLLVSIAAWKWRRG